MSEEEIPPSSSTDEQRPKKAKIDLKARLSSVRATGTMPAVTRNPDDPLSFPPPPMGSVPPPKMVSATGASFMPPVKSAFAQPEPEVKPTVQQQTIKIEGGEELEQERRKAAGTARKYIALAAAAALGVGFLLGRVQAQGAQGKRAVEGASALASDVAKATDAMKDLSHEIGKGAEQLQNEEYPEALVEVLAKTNIDFDAEKFNNKGVGGLPADLLKDLLSYTQGVAALNSKKNGLKNMLTLAKGPTMKYFVDRKEPKVNFSVFLDKRGDDFVALLVPNKEPFLQKGAAPAKYTVTKPPQGQDKPKDVEASRLTAASKLEGSQVVPVDEASVAGLTSREQVFKLIGALGELRTMIEGAEGSEREALGKQGDRVVGALKKVGQK